MQEKEPQQDPDINRFDEPEPLLDNNESQDDNLKDRYGSTDDTTS